MSKQYNDRCRSRKYNKTSSLARVRAHGGGGEGACCASPGRLGGGRRAKARTAAVRVFGLFSLPDGRGRVSEVLERAVERRHQADGRARAGRRRPRRLLLRRRRLRRRRRRRVRRVMPVLGPAPPVVADPVAAVARAGRRVAGLREHFRIQLRQIAVLVVVLPVQTSDLWNTHNENQPLLLLFSSPPPRRKVTIGGGETCNCSFFYPTRTYVRGREAKARLLAVFFFYTHTYLWFLNNTILRRVVLSNNFTFKLSECPS